MPTFDKLNPMHFRKVLTKVMRDIKSIYVAKMYLLQDFPGAV